MLGELHVHAHINNNNNNKNDNNNSNNNITNKKDVTIVLFLRVYIISASPPPFRTPVIIAP